MTEETSKKKMPVWAKILIALVVFGIVSITSIAIGGAFFVQKVYHDALDPQMIKKAADEIAVFSEPLPKDFKYLFGFSNKLLGFDLLVLDNSVAKQYLMFLKYTEQETDSQKLVDRLFESGFATPQTNVKFEAVKGKGNFEVAGQTMPYIVGEGMDAEGHKLQGLAACVVKKETHKATVLYGVQFSEKDYDLAVTEGLLKTIKSL